MISRIRLYRIALVSAVLGSALFQGTLAAAAEFHFATAYGADNFQTQNLQMYADDVARATGGKVAIKVHPAGSLLPPSAIFTGVREGKAEGGEVIMSSLAKEHPLFGMDSLPFIVSGYDDAWRMWQATRDGIDKALRERGLQLLYAVPWPPQNLYSRTEIKGVQDFKGQRMRAYSPATVRIAELVNATPITIQVVDLAKAIAEERLDMMITSSWTGIETQAWTRLTHYYKVSAWIPKNVVFISKRTFDGLDPESREKLLALAQTAEQRGWKQSRNSDQEFEDRLAAHKISVSTMDFFIRRYLDRIGENLAREWIRQAGTEQLGVLLRYTTERSMAQARKN